MREFDARIHTFIRDTKYPRDHWGSQRGNQKTPKNKWQWNHNDAQPMGCSKGSSKREVYGNTILHQETRKISNNNLNLHLKQLEKEEQKIPTLAEGKKS